MRKLRFLTTLLSFIFAACECDIPSRDNSVDGSDGYNFAILTDRKVSVGSGTAIGFISYSIDNPTETGVVDATPSVPWVTSLDCSTYGKVMYSIARNESAEERQATITLTYEDTSLDVVITQAGIEPDTIIEAPKLTGHYYGTIATPINNFYLCFTDSGLGSNYLTNVPNAYYYIVDLFLDAEPVDEYFRVPDGEYTYDMSSGASGTFAYFSWYQENDSAGFPMLQRKYSSGTLVVEGNKLTLTVTLVASDDKPVEQHVVTYEGDYRLYDLR